MLGLLLTTNLLLFTLFETVQSQPGYRPTHCCNYIGEECGVCDFFCFNDCPAVYPKYVVMKKEYWKIVWD